LRRTVRPTRAFATKGPAKPAAAQARSAAPTARAEQRNAASRASAYTKVSAAGTVRLVNQLTAAWRAPTAAAPTNRVAGRAHAREEGAASPTGALGAASLAVRVPARTAPAEIAAEWGSPAARRSVCRLARLLTLSAPRPPASSVAAVRGSLAAKAMF